MKAPPPVVALLSLSSLAATSAVFTPACGGRGDQENDAGVTRDLALDDAPPSDAPPGDAACADFYGCTNDDDCVAVAQVGCCHHGLQQAVSRAHVADYEHSFVCPTPNPICLLYLLVDERVPRCDPAKKQCAMVLPHP